MATLMQMIIMYNFGIASRKSRPSSKDSSRVGSSSGNNWKRSCWNGCREERSAPRGAAPAVLLVHAVTGQVEETAVFRAVPPIVPAVHVASVLGRTLMEWPLNRACSNVTGCRSSWSSICRCRPLWALKRHGMIRDVLLEPCNSRWS